MTKSLTGRLCGANERYKIKELTGEISKVETYKAFDDKLNREVSLQIYSADQTDLAKSQLKIYATLQHPNVLPLLDATKIDDRSVQVLRQMEGFKLSELINGETGLAHEEIFNIIPQLLDVLITLHDLGYMHLGLNPASILLSTGWDTGCRYFLTSFINACEMDQDKTWAKPQPGMFRDFFTYSAPEVLNGGTADERSDLFSLGAVIYHSFCGTPPYVGDSPIEISSCHQKTPPHHLGYFRPEIPSEIANWVMSLIAIEPSERPLNPLEALKSFQKVTESTSQELNLDSRVA